VDDSSYGVVQAQFMPYRQTTDRQTADDLVPNT